MLPSGIQERVHFRPFLFRTVSFVLLENLLLMETESILKLREEHRTQRGGGGHNKCPTNRRCQGRISAVFEQHFSQNRWNSKYFLLLFYSLISLIHPKMGVL